MNQTLVLDRNELLTEEATTEMVLSALPESFRFVCDYSCIKSGRIIAENGHADLQLQYDPKDNLVLVIRPNANAIADKAAEDLKQKLTLRLSHVIADDALKASNL